MCISTIWDQLHEAYPYIDLTISLIIFIKDKSITSELNLLHYKLKKIKEVFVPYKLFGYGTKKKDGSMHEPLLSVRGSGEGSDHIGFLYAILP